MCAWCVSVHTTTSSSRPRPPPPPFLSPHTRLWTTAARAAFPHAATLGDVQSYGGEWKALLRDGNRRNRSALFEWEVADCLGDARRRYSPAFTLEDYTFQVLLLRFSVCSGGGSP